MNRFERRFKSGEIIFREGDASNSAFILVSGQVELVKGTGSKSARLAVLEPGEMFGEMGLVDGRKRSASARARGDVTLDVVDREEFLNAIREKPDVALAVIGNLAERLRLTNEKVRPAITRAAIAAPRASGVASYSRLWAVVKQFLMPGKKPGKKVERRITILAMPIDGDQGQALSAAVVHALDGYDGIRARLLDGDLVPDSEELTLAELLAAARKKIAEEGASLLIWGAINDAGTAVHLRFVSHLVDDDHPGAFYPSDRLCMPSKLTPELWQMLAAVAFAAAVPKTLDQRAILRSHMGPAFEAARQSKQEPPAELSHVDKASIQVCYGNITALLGHQTGESSWYREAAVAYQEALEAVSREDAPLDWASIQRHLAVVRQVLGERAGDADILDNAVAGYRSALETFTRDAFPWEWASLQARLGMTLYRLDALKSDVEILKDGVAALQSAAQVFSRETSPLRWAEVKNGLGQALQVWGDEARSPELLERAVHACQEALQVRSRGVTPLLWAASQNNLGSALFLLGRMTEDSEHLEGAAEAFAGALEVYRTCAATRLAKVAERNLARTEELLRARMARRVAKVYWEDDELGTLRPAEGLPELTDGRGRETPMIEHHADGEGPPPPPGIVTVETAAAELERLETSSAAPPRKQAGDRALKALTELDV